MSFPLVRPRRLRRTEAIRSLVRETHLDPSALIQPLFVVPGTGVRREISSLPGQFHLSPDEAALVAMELRRTGVGGVILFGLPATKDPLGQSGLDPKGPVPEAVRQIKEAAPGLIVMTDVCLCEYTDHGHCGVLVGEEVSNDETLPRLAEMALVHARAGADMVAPSDMMDGRVQVIREALDHEGFQQVAVVSYAAKMASSFYGPFRDAAGSTPAFGDRRSYQMDAANGREALREIFLDEEEGADILIVKPAMSCLDIIARARDATLLPLAAYQVSGEYAMIELAGRAGALDRKAAILESLVSIRRAGADIVITYFAQEVSGWLLGR